MPKNRLSLLTSMPASAVLTYAVVLGLGTVATPSAHTQTFSALYSFTGAADGGNPFAGVIRDSKGRLYGVAAAGGSSNNGTVWKLSSKGKLHVAYTFAGSPDGTNPHGTGVTRDGKGNLYGTTADGGSNGDGTVWEVDASGAETVLHSFAGSDGAASFSGVVRDNDGNLYGTTNEGGSADLGTVWMLSSGGTLTTLHSFAGSDGEYPFYTGLHRDKAGNLYGITEEGGASSCGTLFEINSGGTFSTLHNFSLSTDGCYPTGTVTEDTKGNLYGTAQAGGAPGYGTVWKFHIKSATLKVLHSFLSSDGAYPLGGALRDAFGNFYGTAVEGGGSNYGTVWKLSAGGKLTTLHSFTGVDGAYPYCIPVRDKSGNLYGTAFDGGAFGSGIVWKIAP
jgi:uncharacterized repeat protein (TIGR03803 family)